MLLSRVIAAVQPIQVLGGTDDIDVQYLLTDSRQLNSRPESTLFFALRTEHNDGARYIPELSERGVRLFVIAQDSLTLVLRPDNACFLVVSSPLQALQDLAVYKRSLYHGPLIAITGSNGKTVVKEWLYQLLREDYRIVRSPRSYNSQIGVPLSVWQLREDTTLAIFEAGISQPGEMERLQRILKPTIGVITYIGTEHGENFTSLAHKREEKMLLFRELDKAHIIEDPTHQNVRTCAAVMRALGYDEETITRRILAQTHETVMRINLSALVDNVRAYRDLLNPGTRLTCMVKAFAYGAGSVDVSLALQRAGVADYLAVAVADEGVELRRAGITLPVIVMDPEVAALDIILENNLQPNIYSFQSLENIITAAESKGLENYPIHIKIDSGMHRLGFYREQLPELVQRLQAQHAVRVHSVFSHLATADEPQQDDFTLRQINYFTDCADTLRQQLGYPVIRHILNSAGIERFTPYQMEMCRLGIGMYGFAVESSPQAAQRLPLRPVCSLRAVILSVKEVPAGDTIGYGRHTTLSEQRTIAVIPIGYADGLDRRLSNYAGHVFVRGRLCPIVGNICMDQAMIDVTGTDAQPGDEAEIFGDNIPLQELANQLGTITYEVLTSVSRRVKRVYYYE